MNMFTKLLKWLGPKRLDAEMAEEMRGHLELQTQANLARGMAPDEARFAARREFGGVEQIKETAREQRGVVRPTAKTCRRGRMCSGAPGIFSKRKINPLMPGRRIARR